MKDQRQKDYMNEPHQPVEENSHPRRLTFPVTPPVDRGDLSDREILVAEDEWNGGALLVVPVAVARRDAAYIQSIMTARTVGELRTDPQAWAIAAESYDNSRDEDADEDEGPSESLPDDHPYEPDSWFGEGNLLYFVPLARLRTAETAPRVLDHLMRPDTGVGMDYEPAPWLAADDESAVVFVLVENGYTVVRDMELASKYSDY